LAHDTNIDTAPRYTSYPTAPHFHAGVGAAQVQRWLGLVEPAEPLSLYLHIPFCDKLCWFCACHTRHTLRYEPVARYLDVLIEEIDLVSRILDGRGVVEAIHFGGGSPTMLKPTDLKRLDRALRQSFRISPTLSLAVEIDPSDMDEARLDALAEIGLTRASLGVQDFDPRVQDAINRYQSRDLTAGVIDGLRSRGIVAINLDLVYGLPHQSEEGIAETVSQCLEMAPDRIALFGYAHVPWFKKHQTMIDEAVLPSPKARIRQSQSAARQITRRGYMPIGIDHFALPDDSLSRAADRGSLRRNFQGYTDDACETLIGMGLSSVSRYRQGYAQSHPDMSSYVQAVAKGRLPSARGIELSHEDKVRAWIIERLMCDFKFSISELKASAPDLAPMLLSLADGIARDGSGHLARMEDSYVIPEEARSFARATAARFDAYITLGSARHSSAV
jgi:oxygen-independent coproporphyrinogen-3 oxidase